MSKEALSLLSDALRADAEIVKTAVETHGHGLLADASPSLRADREFLSGLFSDDHRDVLRWVSAELQADRAFVTASARLGARVEFAHESLRDDSEV